MIYLTNGNMPLNAAYADEIVQEDNSTYQLSFRFPTSDSLWEQLKEETFLTADDLHGEQDFVIFEVEKKHGYIQVYANQVFTLLNNYVVNPISLDRATGSTALSRFAGNITRDNPFSFFSDIEDRHTFNVGSKNAMEAFAKDKHSIIGQWGGDLVRHGYQVRLLKNGGSENESLFMYKKNLSSYQHKTSTKSLKTRITFIATVKGEGEKAPDRTFTVTIDSPLINKYSQIYEDVIEVNDQDVKDEASLRKYGEQYYRTSLCDMMEDSLEIEVVGRSDVPVQMYDIVSLFHEVYNLDVRKKITKYIYSPMAKKLKSIGFGQFQSGLANAIGNAVSDAVKGEAQQLQSNFEQQLARELKNADLAFDRQKKELVDQFTDGLNATKAKAEEVKQELSDTIDQRFSSFDNGPLQEAKRRAEEALRNAGASSLLAQEAKRIGLDSVAKLDALKQTAEDLQSELSGFNTYINEDVQRQEALYRYVYEEGERQATAVREQIEQNFVGKSTYQEDVRGIENRFEGITNPKNGTIATQIANYKNSVDGRFAEITSLLSGKANQTDFQRVRETSQLYERILGSTENGIADNVARMAMTNQLFQVEVGKAAQKGRNYYRDSEKVQTKTRFFAFPLYPYLTQENVGETWTLSFDLKINEGGEIRPLHFYHYQTNRFGIKASGDITPSKEWQRFTFTGPVIFPNDDPRYARGEMALYDFGGNNSYSVRRIKFERGSVATEWSPAPKDNDEAIRTVQSQLAGSWGVHNKNSVNEIIAGFNLAGRNAGIKAETIRLEGNTLADKLTAIDGYFKRLFVGEGTFATLNTDILRANSITADKMVMDMAMARRFVSSDIFTDTLAAKEAFINKLRSVVVTATLLEGYKGRIGGFQIGTHEKDSSVYWITGQNQFSVGMSNGSGQWSQTALWVNWGNNWGVPGDYAWYVKNNGKMYCYNTAEFWNTPVIHGNLRVTGHIYYNNENSGKSGYWIHSSKYSNFEPSNNYLYLYYSGSGYDWIPMNKEISDRRYKHNIEASTVSGLDVVKNLKTYSYRKEYDSKIEDIACGIMAQDVQKYAPEAFLENPDGAYSYNTFALVPYLIKAIQELNQKIEEMEKNVA